MDSKRVEAYRAEFPVTRKYIYLDHAGVAPYSLRVKGAIARFLEESAENGAFSYPAWAQRIVEIRRACAGLLNAGIDEVAFVKSTSHGLSIVAEGLDWRPGDNVILYDKEFPSNIYPWLNLGRRGVEVKFVTMRDHRISLEDIAALIDARTRLIAVSSVQYATGFRIDLDRLGAMCRQKNILLCVDAIQSLGIIPMDVKALRIDFLSADAHKWLLGPEGIGIFYCRRELAGLLNPPLIGWKSVENELDFDHPLFRLKAGALRFEEGSMNVMGVFGLGAAVEFLSEVGIPNIQERVLGLGDMIIDEAEARGFSVFTPREQSARGGNVTFAGGFDPARARDEMRKRGIMVNARGGGLRVSPHFYNTEEELKTIFKAL